MKDKKPSKSNHSDDEAQQVIKDNLQETLEESSKQTKRPTLRSPVEQSTRYETKIVSTTSTASSSSSFQRRSFIARRNSYATPNCLTYDDTEGDDFLEDDHSTVRREDPRKVRKREIDIKNRKGHLKHGFLNRSFLNESFKKRTFFLINLAFCKK